MSSMCETRFIRHIAICILLGVATSVFLSWIIAWFPIPTMGSTYTLKFLNPEKGEFIRDSFGRSIVLVAPPNPGKSHLPGRDHPQRVILASAVEEWERFEASWRAANAQSVETIAVCYGWPVRCSWCVLGDMAPTQLRIVPLHGAIEVGRTSVYAISTPRIIPLRFFWLGLAGNTLVYGLIWGLGVFGFRAVRRMRRRRRGRCMACDYDLRGRKGAACPECGTAFADAPAVQSDDLPAA